MCVGIGEYVLRTSTAMGGSWRRSRPARWRRRRTRLFASPGWTEKRVVRSSHDLFWFSFSRCLLFCSRRGMGMGPGNGRLRPVPRPRLSVAATSGSQHRPPLRPPSRKPTSPEPPFPRFAACARRPPVFLPFYPGARPALAQATRPHASFQKDGFLLLWSGLRQPKKPDLSALPFLRTRSTL